MRAIRNLDNVYFFVDVVDWSTRIYYMVIQAAEGVKTAEIVIVK